MAKCFDNNNKQRINFQSRSRKESTYLLAFLLISVIEPKITRDFFIFGRLLITDFRDQPNGMI